jgi:hypothetical protein
MRRVWTVLATIVGTGSLLGTIVVGAAGAASATTRVTTINFDDVTAPCNFNQTVALRDQYASMGVHFSGSGARDGGGILNECGNFGVTGYSAPNFLAFNPAATYSDGGIPNSPQFIAFDSPVNGVRIRAGSDSGGTVQLSAYDAQGHLLGRRTLAMVPALKSIAVGAAGISRVALRVQNSGSWVFDDLAWQ